MNKTLRKATLPKPKKLNLEQFATRTAKQMQECITYFDDDPFVDYRLHTIYKVLDVTDDCVLLEHKDEKIIVPIEILTEHQQLLNRRLLIKVREKNKRYAPSIKAVYEQEGESWGSAVFEEVFYDLTLEYLLFAIDCKVSPTHINNVVERLVGAVCSGNK